MKRAVLYSAALAISVLLIGAAAPDVLESVRTAVFPESGRQALISVGEELGGAQEPVLVDDTSPAPVSPVMLRQAQEDFPLRKMVALNLTGFKLPVSAPVSETTDEAVSVLAVQEAPPPEIQPEAVAQPQEPKTAASADKAEEFMARQAAFSGYALPESVDCSAPELPFQCVRPVSAETTSVFGYRVHPIYGDVRFHYGTDFKVTDGTDIAAFAAGTVRSAGEINGYGLTLVIDHDGGYSTLYAHCSELKCSAGEAVSAGQIVALSGHSGMVTGPHMHFELKRDELYLNPEYYI